MAWVVVVLAWATRVIRHPGSVLFLFAVATAAVEVGRPLVATARGDAWRALRRAIVGVAVLGSLVAFDVGTLDVFNLPKVTIVFVAALALLATWALEWGWTRRRPSVATPLLLPVAAVVGAACLATALSTNPRVSVLGFAGSYDGLALVVACGVLVLGIADAFDPQHVRACLAGLFGAGGGLVALYALFQTHDQVLDDATRWDWVVWGESSFQATSAIWSTLGNPNHLAGFVVVLLPLGIVLGLTARSRRARWSIVALEALLFVELVQTTTRGAWIAAVVSLPLLALLLGGELRRHRRVALAIGGGFVAFALLSLAVVVSTPTLNARYRALLEVGGRDSFTARIELSKAALDIGASRPMTGSGPDQFRIAFQRHQTARFVEVFGPRRVANGAHNLFLNQFATQGVVGVIALLCLVVAATWRGVRAVLSRGQDRDRRLLGAGLVASLAAYLVQATFNVQQVALTVVFWALIGLLDLVARNDAAVTDDGPSAPPEASRSPGLVSRSLAVSATVVCLAAVALAVRPYVADDSALRAARLAADGRYLEAREHARDAAAANPLEARYRAADAQLSALAAQHGPGNPEPRLREAVRAYRSLIDLQPGDASYLHDFSEVLVTLGRRETAHHVLSLAVKANPHDPLLKEKRDAVAPAPPRPTRAP